MEVSTSDDDDERRTGKSLERLVSEIEGSLLGQGYEAKTRVRFFDEDGVPIAELDVQVTGSDGISSLHWIFECRDRPSEGPQGGEWIEQLVGRRKRFQADKIFAVSTTGFAPSAVVFAATEGIALRTVNSIDELLLEFMPLSAEIRHAYIVEVGTPVIEPPAPDVPMSFEWSRILIRRPGKDWQSLEEVHMGISAFEPDEDAEKYPVRHQRFSTIPGCEIKFGDGDAIEAERLIIPYVVETDILQSVAFSARVYAEGETEIGREGDFDFEFPGGIYRVRLQTLTPEEGTRRIRVGLPDGLPPRAKLGAVSVVLKSSKREPDPEVP